MTAKSIVGGKGFAFALKVTALYRILFKQKECVLSRRLLRSGTGIGANIEEALAAQTRKELHSKMTMAFKETRCWLRLLKASESSKKDLDPYLRDAEELNRMVSSITKSTKPEGK